MSTSKATSPKSLRVVEGSCSGMGGVGPDPRVEAEIIHRREDPTDVVAGAVYRYPYTWPGAPVTPHCSGVIALEAMEAIEARAAEELVVDVHAEAFRVHSIIFQRPPRGPRSSVPTEPSTMSLHQIRRNGNCTAFPLGPSPRIHVLVIEALVNLGLGLLGAPEPPPHPQWPNGNDVSETTLTL